MKYLGNSPENLFQRIKRYVQEYEKKYGANSSINVAVGEPDTVPPQNLRNLLSTIVQKDDVDVHTYWDNRDPGDFCMSMIQQITGVDVRKNENLSTLVLPGEKSMLGLLPIVCGAKIKESVYANKGFVRTTPAYDLLGVWSEYIDTECFVWELFSEENFRLNLDHLPKLEVPPKMIITVKPGNPCPAGASRSDWEMLIQYCIDNNVRLVNDGAYTSLTHKNHVSLCEVAQDYPALDWMEFFSISKTLSACGWRLGAAVGSQDFISELAKVKGNADSGPFGPALVACEKYFQLETSKVEITGIQKMYERRLKIAIDIFENAGFKLSCPVDAGFFILFHCPQFLDGELMEDSENFNKKMIDKIGLVGVPFSGAMVNSKAEQFIRYSVCSDFENVEYQKRIKKALAKIEIGY